MKKRILSLSIVFLIFITTFLSIFYLPVTPQVKEISYKEEKPILEKINYEKEIRELQEKYHNEDIIGKVEIPNLLEEAIVQTSNNNYYLHYDIYHNKNIIGASFLDFRNDINTSRKLLIYSHSDPEGTLPFVKLTGYNKEEFWKEHPYIYLITAKEKRKFKVFSSYIETNDFDYVNLENFNGLTYKEHLEKLKNKSYVSSNIELEDTDTVLILQTCSFVEEISSSTKYQLVIGKEIKEKENQKIDF